MASSEDVAYRTEFFKKELARQIPDGHHRAVAQRFFEATADHNRPNIEDFARLLSWYSEEFDNTRD